MTSLKQIIKTLKDCINPDENRIYCNKFLKICSIDPNILAGEAVNKIDREFEEPMLENPKANQIYFGTKEISPIKYLFLSIFRNYDTL